MYVDDHLIMMISFVDWLSFSEGEGSILYTLFFGCLLVPFVYITCTLVPHILDAYCAEI